jgi:hypothetical protein
MGSGAGGTNARGTGAGWSFTSFLGQTNFQILRRRIWTLSRLAWHSVGTSSSIHLVIRKFLALHHVIEGTVGKWHLVVAVCIKQGYPFAIDLKCQ